MKNRIHLPMIALLSLAAGCGRDAVMAPDREQRLTPPTFAMQAPQGDAETLELMNQINADLKARGSKLFLEAVEYYTIGLGRPSARIHQLPFRWVPFDGRRRTSGVGDDKIRYMSDGLLFAPLEGPALRAAPGFTNAAADAALGLGLSFWDIPNVSCSNLDLEIVPDNGANIDVVDNGFPDVAGRPARRFVDPFAPFPRDVDIVNGGWMDRVPYWTSENVIAATFTFIFVTASGAPTDVNNDEFLDTALKDIFWNNNVLGIALPPGLSYAIFPAGPDGRRDFDGNGITDLDIPTVGGHEDGHAVELGHFGPPPAALMNPVYAGTRQHLFAIDDAGACSQWASWPTR